MSQQNEESLWQLNQPKQLLQAIDLLANSSDLPNFLRDVLTEKEILEISARFEAARLLKAGVSYEAIITQTKLSSRTVARISQWLKTGTGGYDAAFKAISSTQSTQPAHHSHIPPARAE